MMHEDIQTLIRAHEELTNLHSRVLAEVLAITDKLKRRSVYTTPETCDIGFLLRELETVLEDWRKDCTARKLLAGKIIAFEVLSDGNMGDTVRGELARGKIYMKKKLKPPKKGSSEYAKAMAHFGVPTTVVEQGIVKLDWEATSDKLTEEMEDGSKALVFLESFDDYGTSWTRKKG